MKSKFKRISKSTMSVILSLCMIMSCMTVGLIATDAAKVDSDPVGANTYYLLVSTNQNPSSWSGSSYHCLSSSSQSFTVTPSSLGLTKFATGTNYYLGISSSTSYTNMWSQGGSSAAVNNSSDLITTAAENYNVGNTKYRFAHFSVSDSDVTSVTVTATMSGTKTTYTFSAAASAPTTWTVIGTCGKPANLQNLFVDEWAPTRESNDMTKSGNIWTKTMSNVYLTATDTISYKVAKNHAWTTTYPSANATKTVSETGYYDATFTYNQSTNAVSLTLTKTPLYTLTVPSSVSTTNGSTTTSTVSATYNNTYTAGMGGTIQNIPVGGKVNITVTPESGWHCTSVTTTSPHTVTGSNNNWTLTMGAADATFTVTMAPVGTANVYFNNNASEYNMVSIYAKRSSDGYEPFGVYPGATMTKLANSDIWVKEVPDDCDKITFTGDNGQNTGELTINNLATATNTMYTAGPNKASPSSSGKWEKYVARTNEYSVSKGTGFGNNIYSGIKATFYDYYTDGELSGIQSGVNDTSEDSGWLKGIANDEFSWRNNGWKWNPYTNLNTALSNYNKNQTTATGQTGDDVTYGLYFGNLNVTTGNPLDMDNNSIGRGNSTDIKNYTGWNQNVNGSVALTNPNNAATGLSGKSLFRNQIHHYKSGVTDENGIDMGMFNEDVLSGWNQYNKPLATILRSPSFPVRKTTVSYAKKIYIDYSTMSSWALNGANIYAHFWVDSNTYEDVVGVPVSGKTNVLSFNVPGPDYTNVKFYRSTSAGTNWWNESDALTYSGTNVLFTTTNSSDKITGSFGACSYAETGSYVYYEYDSTNGKDNAYITNISKSDKTAQLDYYNNQNKVYSVSNSAGFFPFDYNNLNSHTDTNSTTGDVAHDLGFGMKLEIPFTLDAGGIVSGTNIHQVFDFSGDDDLWVFIDNKLVLDLGGAHARTTGSIDFADKTVTAPNQQPIGGTRNNGFSWFDNTDPDAIHTMTIYYMERGMYESNLKFGFSFHAVTNQLKTEKKVRTAYINQGFFFDNNTTKSDMWIDNKTDYPITWFEKAVRHDDFEITHKLNGSSIGTKSYTLNSNGVISSSAPTNGTYTNTALSTSDGKYTLHNDDIAIFKGVFTKDTLMTLSETDDHPNNQFEYDESVQVFDDANVDSDNNSKLFDEISSSPTQSQVGKAYGTATSGYSFRFSETDATGFENLNIRTRFTNQMKSHDLRIVKESNKNDNTDFTIRIKFNFDVADTNNTLAVNQGYIPYQLWGEKTARDGTRSSVQLNEAGEVTLKGGEVLYLPNIPEAARIRIEEPLSTSSDYACTGIKVVNSQGSNVNTSSDSSTAGSTTTKYAEFTMPGSDVTGTFTNEAAEPLTITHSLHPDSTGTGTCTVTAQVQTSTGTVRKTYPVSGTADSVTIPTTYIKRGTTDKIVITLNTSPTSPSYLEKFYQAIDTTIKELDSQGIPYTINTNDVTNGTATVTINVSALFDNTTGSQKYTTLPFYSKLLLPKYDLSITKSTNGETTSETFDFEVYKKVGLVYEKITTDPGFTFTGTGTGTFNDGTLTLSSGKTATMRVTHGEIYEVVELPKSNSLFGYDSSLSTVTSSDSNAAVPHLITNGFDEILISGDTTVTLVNKKIPEYTANVKIQYYNSSEDTTPKDDTMTTVTSDSGQKKQGSTTNAKVYFLNDPTTVSDTVLARDDSATFALAANDVPSPANGYEFVGWFVDDGTTCKEMVAEVTDSSTQISYEDAQKADANKTFIVRYRKADETGSVTIDHNLISSAPANCGTPTLTVEVYNDEGTKVATYPASGTSNSVTIDDTYIKYDTTNNYKLRVILNTNVNSGFRFDDFYKTNSTANAIGSSDYLSRDVSTNPATVTIKDIDVNSTFFQTESDGRITFKSSATPIHYFSNIIKQYTATVKIQYMDDNFDNDWNDESSYTNNVQGDETGAKVYFGTDDTSRTVTVDSGENFNYTKADPNPANGYDFVDWYYYDEDNDSYLKIVTGTAGSGEISETEAKKADADKTFVARYHKNTLNKYEFTYKYKSRHLNSNSTDENDRVYGEQTFTSKGEITAEELAEYFDVDGSTSFKFKDDTVTRSYKQEFIAAKSPYEKNFKEKITWNFSAATVNVVYDSTNKYWTVKTAADVTADYDYDPKLSVDFYLPYDYTGPATTTSIVPGENDGVVPVTEQATIGGKTMDVVRKISLDDSDTITFSGNASNSTIMRARFLKWVTLNEIKSLEDLNNARATNPNAKALFIKAPESIYDGQDNEWVFRYWSMKDLEKIEYAKCYSNEFNMALYQSSIIEPIYEQKTGGNASQLDENAAFDTNNKMATIAFLENSRMQWNENGGGSKISDDLKQYSGDKLVTDFALAFDYQGLELRSKKNYAFGVVVEKLEGAIDPNNVPTNAQLTQEHKNDNLTTAKNAVQAELVSKAYDNMINKTYFSSDNANKYQISSSPTKNTLDNKNELEYYFAMDKFTNSYVDKNDHSKGITSTETGLHLNKYRAFSFLMVPCKTQEDSETVEIAPGVYAKFIISDPVYFTNYTEASISNGATN